MAVQHGSEQPEIDAPHGDDEQYPPEQPSDWGWHGEFGRSARVAGWIVVLMLLVMITTTHYNGTGTLSLIITAALIVVALLWDMNRRRTSWRK